MEALSTRKLVLETAKFNVITAYSGNEALEVIDRFPDSDAVIMHDSLGAGACSEVASAWKKKAPGRLLIVLAEGHGTGCKGADRTVSSHEPHALLELLREQFGSPAPSPNGKK